MSSQVVNALKDSSFAADKMTYVKKACFQNGVYSISIDAYFLLSFFHHGITMSSNNRNQFSFSYVKS